MMTLRIRPSDLCTFNVEEHPISVLVVEGRNPSEHLVDEDAKGPPVGRLVMACAQKYLWRYVFGRAAESVRFLGHLSEAKVG